MTAVVGLLGSTLVPALANSRNARAAIANDSAMSAPPA
jgi:hypothetical protein